MNWIKILSKFSKNQQQRSSEEEEEEEVEKKAARDPFAVILSRQGEV